jgi:hypothetical protein
MENSMDYLLPIFYVMGALAFVIVLFQQLFKGSDTESECRAIITAIKEVREVRELTELEQLQKDLQCLERRDNLWNQLDVSNESKNRRNQLFLAYNQLELRYWAEERIKQGITDTKAKIAELKEKDS